MNKKILFITIGIFVVLLAGILVFNSRSDEITINEISDRESINKLREIDLDKVEKEGFLLSYKASEKELTIESPEEDTELQIQLTSDHTTTGLIASSDVKVADFLLIDWGDSRKILIDSMDYFDAKEDFKPINREVWFKYGTEKEVCEESDSLNGSFVQPNCYNSITWTRFNTLDELPHKNIKVSMWTNTHKGESVEWIPTINGFDILQWAAWNISEAVYDGNNNLSSPITSPDSFTFGDSGTKAYFGGTWINDVVQYDCPFAYILPTCVNSNKNKTTGSRTTGLDFSDDGGAFYQINSINTGTMSQWNMSTAWDVSTATFTWNSSEGLGGNGSTGIRFGSNGSKLYTTDVGNVSVTLWDCATSWNLSSCNPINKFHTTPEPRSAFFNIDGNLSFVVDSGTDKVHQFNCSTAWDATSCINSGINISISTPHTAPRDIYFQSDGSAFHIIGQALHIVTKWVIIFANPSINIVSPSNNTNWSNVNLDINYTAFAEAGLSNCWYSNDSYSANTTLTNCGTNITDVIWTESQHNVTIWANDTASNEGFSRVSFAIDTTDPEVNITYPFDPINYTITGNNLTINWTVSDTNLESCWGSFDGGTNNVSLTCGDLNITRNITSFTNDTFTIWANDSVGNVGVSSRTWIYKIFEVEQVFSSKTLVGSIETFIMNMSLGSGETITEVNFDYNGTEHSATAISLGGSEYNLSSTFIIPTVDAIVNMSFFWRIDLASEQINTTAKNQTLNNIDIDDCSIFSTLIFNYTLIDEETQNKITNTTINGTSIEVDLAIFDETKTTLFLNFSQEFNDINPVQICLNVNITESTIYAVDSTVKYEAVNYSIEYYNIQKFLMRNSTIPQRINLFDLKLADATEFQITFKDSDFVVVEDALVQINRQYIPEGLFKTVEIPKTDSNGQTVAHLVEKNVVYNMIVLKGGSILGTFNNVIAFCEDIVIGSCFISLNALTIGEPSFEYDEDVGLFFDFDYNESTRDLQFDFSTTDGSTKNVTLLGVKIDQLGNTSVCNSFLVSSSGTITCAVPISVGNETIIVSIFVDGDLKIQNYISAGRAFDIGDAGYFLMFFLVLSLALMMTQSKTAVIIGVILGFIASSLFSFVGGGILAIGSSVIWLIIMGIILIYKLNKQKQT